MRANWIEHTCTGGSGTLTLSRSGSLPMFTDVYGTSGTILVEYEADDGSNYEAGIGSLALSTNVLTRSTVRETWNGTTYLPSTTSGSAPTALTLGNPTTVRCTPLSRNIIPPIPFPETTLSNNGLFVPGNILETSFSSAATLTASTIWYYPVLFHHSFVLNKIGFQFTSVASSQARFALYRIGSDGMPDELLVDAGNYSGAASGMVVNSSASWAAPTNALRIEPGWYFGAWWTSATVPNVSSFGGTAAIPMLGDVSARAGRGVFRNCTFGGAFAQVCSAQSGAGAWVSNNNNTYPVPWLGP